MKILAIETSCDETAAAVISLQTTDNRLKKTVAEVQRNGKKLSVISIDKNIPITDNHILIQILSNVVASQIPLHAKFGGVFPEVASRAHTENIISVIKKSLQTTDYSLQQADLSRHQTGGRRLSVDGRLDSIDLIAVTTGPGLIGSLLVGVNTAKTLAYAHNLPIIGINHWLGHIYSCFTGEILNNKLQILNEAQNSNFKIEKLKLPQFPLLALIVSGGHTGLVYMKSHTEYEQIGQTLDDAAGEAFDKVAKILALGYPGGPAISKLAISGNPKRFDFPRSMLDRDDFNFSFSGLKTAVLYESKKHKLDDKTKADFAASFQQCVIDILIGKTLKAAQKYQPKSILLCGGVSANKELREQMAEAISLYNGSCIKYKGKKTHNTPYKIHDTISFHVPPLELTGDNAAMIGIAAAYQIANGKQATDYSKIKTNANLKL